MKNAKARLLFLFAASQFSSSVIFLPTASAAVSAVIGSNVQQNDNLPGFLPVANADEILISRKQYVISYNKTRRAPNWVAWRVDSSTLGTLKRSNDFEMDQDLQNYLSTLPGTAPAVDPTEYRGSCFDRGHQSPSGDHTASVEDNQATFLMSNMIPQTPYLNRVIWEHLESYTRDLVLHDGKVVYVVAGPIYDENFGAIGPNHDIQVPSKNFKLVVAVDAALDLTKARTAPQVISVIMPNRLADGSAPTDQSLLCGSVSSPTLLNQTPMSKDDWQQYQISISEIERLSGVKLH